MIGPEEESSTASAAHAEGTYFTYNDLLYRATADIAVDDTITPNANCVAKTVGGELEDLKSALERAWFNEPYVSIWAQGSINVATGGIDGSNVRIHTEFLPKRIIGAKTSNGYQFGVFVYNASGEYIGVYDGTTIQTGVWSIPWLETVDLAQLENYKIKLSAKNASDTAIDTQSAVNIDFVNIVDESLTHSGTPADAKAAGDAIDALKDTIETISFANVLLEQGSISTSTGANYAQTNRIRTQEYLYGNCYLSVPDGYKIYYAYYYDDDTLEFDSYQQINAQAATIGKTGCVSRVNFAAANETDTITPEKFKHSLSLENIAKQVNDNVKNLDDNVKNLDTIAFANILLEQGGIFTSDGSDIDVSPTRERRVRSGYIYGNCSISVPTGYKIKAVYYYDKTTLAFDSYTTIESQTGAIGKTGCVARVAFSAINDTDNIHVEDFKHSLELENIAGQVAINTLCISDLQQSSDAVSKFASGYGTINLDSLKEINTLGTWNNNVYTYNGITYTINTDMSVAVQGTTENTSNGASSMRLYSFNAVNPIDVVAINPSFDKTDDVYIGRMAGNGSLQKYPKGVSKQTIPSGTQRVIIRVEKGKTVNATTGKVQLLTGGIIDFSLNSEVTSRLLETANYNPYKSYSYTGTIKNPSELKTEYSASNMLEAIYAFCDELVTDYPNFVTKQELEYDMPIVDSLPDAATVQNGDIYMVPTTGGYYQYIKNNGAWVQMHTWDNNGNDVNIVKLTYPMYAYTISPFEGCNYPIILWCSGLHGSEDWSNVSTLYLFKELLANRGQNDDIDYLLSNFVIKIIPCCGVSACADRTLGPHAMSENGVNPNRDFPIYWQESSSEWNRTGNYPWYDPYNRILKTYLESLNNVVYCINKHDSNTLTSDGFVNNIWDNFISANNVEDKIFKQLDLTIKAKYTWLLSEFVGTGVSWNPNERTLCKAQYVYGTHGSFEQWYNSIGYKGGLIETVCKTGTAYSDAGHDADFYRIALECDVMTLCAVAKNIKTFAITDELGNKNVAS